MKFKREKAKEESKRLISSILMYVSSAVVALAGIASLINSIRLFNMSISNYVGQGYKRADVLKQMVPGQLLPAIFEAVAFYGGIAVILLCAGIINKKISKTLDLLSVDKSEENIETEEVKAPETEPVEVYNEISELIKSAEND